MADLTAIVANTTLFGNLDDVLKLSSYIVMGNTANAKYQGQTLGNLDRRLDGHPTRQPGE